MSQRCKTCSSGKQLAIDKDLLANLSYPTISAKHGVPISSLKYHTKNHLGPLMNRAKARIAKIAEATLVESARKYRAEVYLPPIEKEFWAQDQLMSVIDCAEEPVKIAGLRTFHNYLDMQHKVSGNYKESALNPHDAKINGVLATARTFANWQHTCESCGHQNTQTSVKEQLEAYLELHPDDPQAVRDGIAKELGQID